MSETKVPRSIPEIQQDYSQACVKAGNLQYQIVTLEKDLQLLNEQLRDLNAEAFSSNEASERAKAAKPVEEISGAV